MNNHIKLWIRYLQYLGYRANTDQSLKESIIDDSLCSLKSTRVVAVRLSSFFHLFCQYSDCYEQDWICGIVGHHFEMQEFRYVIPRSPVYDRSLLTPAVVNARYNTDPSRESRFGPCHGKS